MATLKPDRLLRVVVELIFVMLGVIVIWLGLTGHIFFDRHKSPWLILSAALIIWGLSGLYRPNQWWSRGERWTRGVSLTLLGVVMLAISRVPFELVGRLLAVTGVILALRGLIGAMLILLPR